MAVGDEDKKGGKKDSMKLEEEVQMKREQQYVIDSR